jgi:hypothetical protein
MYCDPISCPFSVKNLLAPSF